MPFLKPDIFSCPYSSLASPDSETVSNNLVLVAHGIGGDLARLEEMKISKQAAKAVASAAPH
jgi:hypothetical protein